MLCWAHTTAATPLSHCKPFHCRTLLNSSKELKQHYQKPIKASPAAAAELSRPKHVNMNSLVTLAASEQGMAAAAAVLAQQRAQQEQAAQRQATVQQQSRLKLQQWHQEQVRAGGGGMVMMPASLAGPTNWPAIMHSLGPAHPGPAFVL